MGGLGSGREKYASTPTVEASRHLDADDLTDALAHPETVAIVWWGEPEDPTAWITVAIEGESGDDRAPAIRLTYTVTNHRTGEECEHDHRVQIEYTDCHFGGVRPWFRCPRCSDRVRKLYCPPTAHRYLCRECHDLGYLSSRRSGDDLKQAELRYRRAFEKADARDRRPHPNGAPYLPERPTGMHRETFEERLAAVDEACEAWHRESRKWMRSRLDMLLARPEAGAEA